MPPTAITAPPFTIQHPYVLLGDITTGLEVHCAGTHLTMEPSQDENTVETFCGVYTTYKAEKWTITFTVAMSYGTDGFWNQVRPLVGTVVSFAIRPDEGVASADNPELSGTAMLKAFPFIDADPGTPSEVDVVLGVQGEVLQDIGTGPAPMFSPLSNTTVGPHTELAPSAA